MITSKSLVGIRTARCCSGGGGSRLGGGGSGGLSNSSRNSSQVGARASFGFACFLATAAAGFTGRGGADTTAADALVYNGADGTNLGDGLGHRKTRARPAAMARAADTAYRPGRFG